MSALSIRLPESLHKNAKLYAAQEGISVNQLIGMALAEKLSALAAQDYLEQRAARGSRALFDSALASVPETPPELGDSPVEGLPKGDVRAALDFLSRPGGQPPEEDDRLP